jgi:hypothetical protein
MMIVRVLVEVLPQVSVATIYPGAEKVGCEGFGFL